MLINAYIPEYAGGNRFNHEPRRHRKILLHRRQIDRLIAAVQREGRTIVPTKLYWDEKGRAKLELALAKGKSAPDKRQATAERDWQRDKAPADEGPRLVPLEPKARRRSRSPLRPRPRWRRRRTPR